MHSYRKSEPGLWTVGFEVGQEATSNHFRAIKDFDNEPMAAAFASYLNGGASVDEKLYFK